MNLKGLVDKAKNALRSNPDLIEKGGNAIDKVTGNKYQGQVDKAQDAARKAVGAEKEGDQSKGAEQKEQAPKEGGEGDKPAQ